MAQALSRTCPKLGCSTARFCGAARQIAVTPRRTVARRAGGGEMLPTKAAELTGVIFQPFEEVQLQLREVDTALEKNTTSGGVSLARMGYSDQLEAAVNEQINVEYNNMYAYHSLAAFFDRDDVGLPGFAAYFKQSSDEEREHANKLMVQQNRRGGRVKLQTILRPESEFDNEARGEALWALELALALEKLNFGKLRELHKVAEEADDAEMCQFIEEELLKDQAQDIKKAADLVSRLRRAGRGHGTFHLDLVLQQEYGYGLEGNGAAGAAA